MMNLNNIKSNMNHVLKQDVYMVGNQKNMERLIILD